MNFLDQPKKKGQVEGREAIVKWVEKETVAMKFNSYEIRNIVSSALGIARAEKNKLKLENLSKSCCRR
jgi:hypothetical protein